jgi:hypothetical protein
MPAQAVLGVSVLFSFIAWGAVAWRYIWPALRDKRRDDALRPLLTLHAFRFVGMVFLVPGVVSPELPAAFARPAAYGDLVAAVLALFTLGALPSRLGFALAWIFNVWGTADLLNAFYEGNRSGLQAGQLGAGYFIPTLIVPLLFITHGLMFRILLTKSNASSTGA